MRKNDVRKWLHAILDLLPVFVIPLLALAVRSDNNFSPISIEVQENKEVNFNQLASANFNTWKNDYYCQVTKNNATGTQQWWQLNPNITYEQGHKYYARIRGLENASTDDYLQLANFYQIKFTENTNGAIITLNTINDGSLGMVFNRNAPQGTVIKFYLNIIDLTFMFGAGNEPTQSQFDEWYPNNYYDYTTYQKDIVPDILTTYNDTDVGSQMVYTLYNTVNKYFNMDKVFNLHDIWNWVNNTMFQGSAPLSAYVVYNIIAYEFIMDIIFLMYAVFMFVIDFAESCLDSAFYKSKRGIHR